LKSPKGSKVTIEVQAKGRGEGAKKIRRMLLTKQENNLKMFANASELMMIHLVVCY